MATSTIKRERTQFKQLYKTGSTQALTASARTVSLTQYDGAGADLTLTNDGGVICGRNGRVKVSGWCVCSGVTSGDKVALQLGRYRGSGWSNTDINPEMYSSGVGAAANVSIPTTVIAVQANDQIYLRCYNISAARGNIVYASLRVEYVK